MFLCRLKCGWLPSIPRIDYCPGYVFAERAKRVMRGVRLDRRDGFYDARANAEIGPDVMNRAKPVDIELCSIDEHAPCLVLRHDFLRPRIATLLRLPRLLIGKRLGPSCVDLDELQDGCALQTREDILRRELGLEGVDVLIGIIDAGLAFRHFDAASDQGFRHAAGVRFHPRPGPMLDFL